MNYFKSNYNQVTAYGRNWYGTMDYAPNATVLLYDDNINECIGYMVAELPVNAMITDLTEGQANNIIDNYEDADGVWFGDKLEHRWDDEEQEEDE